MNGNPRQYHRASVKQRVLGNNAGQPAPAWAQKHNPNPPRPGSKIYISGLPYDVGGAEIGELLAKTVGPLRDHFLVYNSQGLSKGSAVVEFQRRGDAQRARAEYNGKLLDGKRKLTIEIIHMDGDVGPEFGNGPGGQGRPSLVSRMDRSIPTQPRAQQQQQQQHQQQQYQQQQARQRNALPPAPAQLQRRPPPPPKQQPQRQNNQNQQQQHPIAPRKVRQKKGAKRVKKLAPTTSRSLDQEMDDYRSASDIFAGIAPTGA